MSVTVTLGMTLWNNGVLAPLTISALVKEHERLLTGGLQSRVLFLDNASWDGTNEVADYTSRLHQEGVDCEIVDAPMSATSLRNMLVDASKESDYLVLVDGDIEVLPHSIIAMIHYLSDHPSVSAIAMDPLLQRAKREECDTYCRSIATVRRDPLMYLCGYGVFDRTLFRQVAFDEEGPLGQCGWGSEDDDFWFQMVDLECEAVYATGFAYYHPEPRSSWSSLKAIGIDPVSNFEARRAYVMQKWRDRRSERVAALLHLLEAQHVRTE